jgi:chitinase
MRNYFNNLSPYQKRYIPIYIIMSVFSLISFILLFTFPIITHDLITDKDNITKSGWPVRVAAPYIDMSSWVDTASAYSINGVPNLSKLYDESGFTYFNLGFIQPATEKPLADDGTIIWGWGGYLELGKNGNGGKQYQGIVNSLANLRQNGGDYAISVGGQLGDAPWVVTQNQDALEKFYLDVIETYDLKRLDLDIEETNQDQSQNQINAKAIKAIQDKTNVQITLTIPIMPSGWQQKQINIINAYLDAGVEIALINSMTMCYGAGVYENEDYGTASVRAIDNSIKQLKTIYSNHGINLTDDQAYLKTGATFSIGYESELYPTFTTQMATTIVEDAKKHGYGMVSMWSMGRDAILEPNKDIKTQYAFSNILNTYNKD